MYRFTVTSCANGSECLSPRGGSSEPVCLWETQSVGREEEEEAGGPGGEEEAGDY